jgi:hypothetical protein
MEGSASDDEVSWYEDAGDWEESDEPAITYREAITELQGLIHAQGRTDVRIDWEAGGRGPQGDARIVFTDGTAERRLRFGSASQLADFARIITSAVLPDDRHALWYPGSQLITARLVGDYDQVHIAVLRTLAPKLRNATFVRDSPLGRDVEGILESYGAFTAVEQPTLPGSGSRTISIRSAGQDLRMLYGPRSRAVPSMAIELAGFAVADASTARQVLLDYGTSYLFELVKGTGVSLRLWHSEYRLGSRKLPALSGRAKFPQLRYDEKPAELYAAGNSADRDPIEQYLKYYQVLEFYMPKAADLIAKSEGVPKVGKAHSPLRPPPDNELRLEPNRLDAVISLALTPAQVASLLSDRDLFASLSNPKVIKDVQALTALAGHPDPSTDYRLEISKRIYGIRTRIVHMKEGGSSQSPNLLTPYGREARDLAADLRLIRFLAEHAMRHWARPIP